jgi:glycosyltransferase involved in cell wall biosynthesis
VKTAVIVTTYNRPDALAAVLAGYEAQSTKSFELLVADDGSTSATREVVDQFSARAKGAIQHVWHEDLGFRAAAIRNRALATASADYIIFTDGDCIPDRDFVATHQRLAEAGYFVAGNRILLSERMTARALSASIPLCNFSGVKWLGARLRGDINRLLPLIRLPDGGWRKSSPDRWKGIKTCNVAAWRDDLVRVNGLDESYSGWGLEDSDLVIRLLHAGVKHKSARFAAPVFHLWHKENDRASLAENQRKLDALLASTRVRAEEGLDQYG